MKYIKKVSNPYMMNEMSRAITAVILNYDVQPVDLAPTLQLLGARDACGDKLIMAERRMIKCLCLLRH